MAMVMSKKSVRWMGFGRGIIVAVDVGEREDVRKKMAGRVMSG